MNRLVPIVLMLALVSTGADSQQQKQDPEIQAQYAKLTREVELLRYRIGVLENMLRRTTWDPTKEADPVLYDRMKPFMFNPAASPDRICSVTIRLVLASPTVTDFIEKRNLHVRLNDAVLAFFASRTLEDLTSGQFAALKEGVRDQANRIVGTDGVTDVLIQELVVQ